MVYRVCAQVTISLYAEVEAESEGDARAAAEWLAMPDVCYSCGRRRDIDEGAWSYSEIDGDAMEIEARPAP